MALLASFDKTGPARLYSCMGMSDGRGLKLNDDERLLACVSFSLWAYATRHIVALAFVGSGFVLGDSGYWGFPLTGWLAGAFLAFWAELDRFCGRVWITDQRIAIRVAWIHRGPVSLDYAQLESCTTSASRLQRPLGLGSLWAHSESGATALLIAGVHESTDIAALAQRAMAVRRSKISPAAPRPERAARPDF